MRADLAQGVPVLADVELDSSSCPAIQPTWTSSASAKIGEGYCSGDNMPLAFAVVPCVDPQEDCRQSWHMSARPAHR